VIGACHPQVGSGALLAAIAGFSAAPPPEVVEFSLGAIHVDHLYFNGTATNWIRDGMPLLWAIREIPACTAPSWLADCAVRGHVGHLTEQAFAPAFTPLSSVAGRASAPSKGWTAAGKALQAPGSSFQLRTLLLAVGQVMSATALLENNSAPSDANIYSAMIGNICVGATYNLIRAAIHSVRQTREGLILKHRLTLAV